MQEAPSMGKAAETNCLTATTNSAFGLLYGHERLGIQEHREDQGT